MTTTSPANPYLAGNFAPVHEEVSATDLPVTGRLPRELDGRYLRIGPNPGPDVDVAEHHWFMGEGMVHGVRLRDGRAEWYRNRFVRGENGETPNTNVLSHGGRLLALVEAGAPAVQLDPDLGCLGTWDADGALRDGFTAHPRIDPEDGELHAITYNPAVPDLRYLVLDADGTATHSTTVEVDGVPMVHDMALTATRVVVLDLPVALSPDVLPGMADASAYSYRRFPFRWDEHRPSRVGVLPRAGAGSEVRWFDAPRSYVFHVLNAYDEPDGRIVVDVVRYDEVFRHDLRAPADAPPVLARWTIDPATGVVGEQVVTDHSVEFPRVAPALIGRRHRVGWFAGFGAEGLVLSDDVARSRTRGFETGPLVKVDLVTGEAVRHDHGPGRVTMEPVFVPRPGASAEDDGWVLSVIYDATTDRGELVVVDATDLAAPPVARVHLPRRVPFGFHGNWIPDAG